MRRVILTMAAASAIAVASMVTSAGAASVAAPGAMRAAADSLNVIESVQYMFGGRHYCWYDDGWMGAGWYWCGYGARVGLGWGGGLGWHNWGHGGGVHFGGGHFGGGHFGGGGGHFGGGHGGGHHSDVRLKEDIVPLARLDNGLGLYRFRYKGHDHTQYVGVMAQEVEAVEPSAVSRDRNGYLLVDYDRLGLRFMTWSQFVAARADQQPH